MLGLKALSLKFLEEDMEKSFLEDYSMRSVRQLRFAILTGMFLYAIFGILDTVMVSDAKKQIWFIRYALVCPYFAAGLLLTFSRRFNDRVMQLSASSVAFVGGVGIIAMIVLASPPGKYYYYAGLILVIIFTCVFIKLRFIYATAVSWAIVGIYEFTDIWISHTPLHIIVNNAFFLVSAALMGMFACHGMESYARKDFLLRHAVAEEQKREDEKKYMTERMKMLMDLHDGVGGIFTNINALAELALLRESIADIKQISRNISVLSREGVSEIRGFMYSLSAKERDWHSLIADMRASMDMLESLGINFDFNSRIEEIGRQPEALTCLNVLKIYKEALNNIVKHSGAKNVAVDIGVSGKRFSLSIKDDGVGIGAGISHGRGMKNMHKRAEELGGRLAITSERGTTLHFETPL